MNIFLKYKNGNKSENKRIKKNNLVVNYYIYNNIFLYINLMGGIKVLISIYSP